MGRRSRRRSRGLTRRLVAGSLAVALASIALLAAVTLVVADADLVSAGREQEASATTILVTTLRSSYRVAGGWRPSNLGAIGGLARTIGLGLELTIPGHRLLDVASSQTEGPSRRFPIVVAGQRVGTATIQYPASGLSLAEAHLRHRIGEAVAAASLVAALLALVAAVIASRRLVAPVALLTSAARRLGAGDLSSRAGHVVAPREIEELARSFDSMASHIERQDALRRAIVADLAHELRTPLAVLQAELEALSVGLEELTPSAVASLSDEVTRLARLVEDLEVLAAAEATRLSLERQRVNLADVAETAAARLEARFVDRALTLTIELVSTAVIADPGRVDQMVVNLLSNAAKFTPRGGAVRLSVGHDRSAAHLVVADTGIGIPLEEQGRVFDRFFRGAGARATAGSGVGLAVVAELAAAHGASVSLESSPGVGTTVTLSFPLA